MRVTKLLYTCVSLTLPVCQGVVVAPWAGLSAPVIIVWCVHTLVLTKHEAAAGTANARLRCHMHAVGSGSPQVLESETRMLTACRPVLVLHCRNSMPSLVARTTRSLTRAALCTQGFDGGLQAQ